MTITANELKNGSKFEHEGDVWVVTKNPVHTKPGKGGAYVQLEIRSVFHGVKTNKRFSSSERFVRPFFEQIEMQYLYTEDNRIVLMHLDTFEQIEVSKELVSADLGFLQDGMHVKVEFYKQQAVLIILPSTIIDEISETEPVIKGSTVTSSFKPAILASGVRVLVPSYIVPGDKIIVKTEDSSFVSRAK